MKIFWWDKIAFESQRLLMESDSGDKRLAEQGIFPEIPISDFEAKKAALHTRHDMVLIASLLSSINLQLQWIRWILIIAVISVIYIALKA